MVLTTAGLNAWCATWHDSLKSITAKRLTCQTLRDGEHIKSRGDIFLLMNFMSFCVRILCMVQHISVMLFSVECTDLSLPYTRASAMIPPIEVPTIQSKSSVILFPVFFSICRRISICTRPRIPPPSRQRIRLPNLLLYSASLCSCLTSSIACCGVGLKFMSWIFCVVLFSSCL